MMGGYSGITGLESERMLDRLTETTGNYWTPDWNDWTSNWNDWTLNWNDWTPNWNN